MRNIAALGILGLIGCIALQSCMTNNYCPSCMPAKPSYYNKEKAREARRIMNKNKHSSATGGNVLGDPEAGQKQGKVIQPGGRNNKRHKPNEPVL